MNNIIRAGVIGVGHIGRNHARIYADLPDVKLAAVFDASEAAARETAETHGAEISPGLEDFASRVDAASIAAPTPAHYELALPLLERGIHLLIEKPITERTAQARELAERAAASGAVLQVGHVERFNPVMAALEKQLTLPRFIEAHRLSPYPNRSTEIGVALDLMIHDLEIILHLVRSPVKSLDAVGVSVLSKTEDIANARLRFENGCVANVTASRISPERMRKIRVFQEDAYLSLDYQNQEGEIYRKKMLGINRQPVQVEKGEPLRLQLAEFIACAREGRTPRVTGESAAAALDLALEITGEIHT